MKTLTFGCWDERCIIKWWQHSYQIIQHPHERFKLLLTNLPLGRRSAALPCRGPGGTGFGLVLPRIQED